MNQLEDLPLEVRSLVKHHLDKSNIALTQGYPVFCVYNLTCPLGFLIACDLEARNSKTDPATAMRKLITARDKTLAEGLIPALTAITSLESLNLIARKILGHPPIHAEPDHHFILVISNGTYILRYHHFYEPSSYAN